MYKTTMIKDIQHRLEGFAFNQLIRLMKKKRNICGFAWEVQDHKCIIISPPMDDNRCLLAISRIKVNKRYRSKSPPTKFTFFFT